MRPLCFTGCRLYHTDFQLWHAAGKFSKGRSAPSTGAGAPDTCGVCSTSTAWCGSALWCVPWMSHVHPLPLHHISYTAASTMVLQHSQCCPCHSAAPSRRCPLIALKVPPHRAALTVLYPVAVLPPSQCCRLTGLASCKPLMVKCCSPHSAPLTVLPSHSVVSLTVLHP